MTRVKSLRDRLGWSQRQMAAYLRLAQPAIARMEAGQREQGPVSVVLDALERELDQRGAEGVLTDAEIGRGLLSQAAE